jgi:hypothetical protein
VVVSSEIISHIDIAYRQEISLLETTTVHDSSLRRVPLRLALTRVVSERTSGSRSTRLLLLLRILNRRSFLSTYNYVNKHIHRGLHGSYIVESPIGASLTLMGLPRLSLADDA